MSRKVYVKVETRLILNIEEDESVDSVMENLHTDFVSNNEGAEVDDWEIREWTIEDSK